MSVKVTFKGGGSYVKHPPIFSQDSEQIFIAWRNKIISYNSKTAKLTCEYSCPTEVVGFDVMFYEETECLVACTSCKVFVWKIGNCSPLQIIDTEYNITTLKCNKMRDENYVQIGSVQNEEMTIISINLINPKAKHKVLFKTHYKSKMDLSDKHLFLIQKHLLIVFSLLTKKVKKLNNSQELTCVSCHKTEEMVLTGDKLGRVILWRDFNRMAHSIYHWHTLPVQTVCFSSLGSYFYSGGEEAVLVKWEKDDQDKKQFLPRLPDSIQQLAVSCNNIYTAVATKDNAIRILDSRFNQVSLIQNLVLEEESPVGILYDPRTKSLVLNGSVGHLQFCSPKDMTVLYNIDVVGRNKITNEREFTIENVKVKKAAISQSGIWLATVEERLEQKYHNEIRLKFWKFNLEKQTFELNTCVEYPHEKTVSAIGFQTVKADSNPKLVSLADRNFKIWKLEEVDSVYKKGLVWDCFAIGFYRDYNCYGLSFSMDGSLMAIGFEEILTCWTPDSCELKCSLVHPTQKGCITQVEFGKGNLCHLLVAGSKEHLSVWNLLTLSLVWTVKIDLLFLFSDSVTTNMAIVTRKNKVFVFSPDSPKPIYTSKDSAFDHDININAGTFVPCLGSNNNNLAWYNRSHLYLKGSNELICLSPDEQGETNDEFDENAAVSLFSQMQPEIANSKVVRNQNKTHLFQKDIRHQNVREYLDSPLETMIPIRFLCSELIRGFVVEKSLVN